MPRPAASRTVDPCPTGDSLAGLMSGALTSGEAGPLLDHLIDCQSCSDVVRAAAPVHDLLARRFDRMGRLAPLASLPVLRIAATVLMLAGGGLWLIDELRPGGTVLRGGPIQVVGSRPADGVELDEAPEELAVRAIEGQSIYRFEIYDADLQLMWESSWRPSSLLNLPVELRSRLNAGTYSWRVVVDVEGEHRVLPFLQFTVVP